MEYSVKGRLYTFPWKFRFYFLLFVDVFILIMLVVLWKTVLSKPELLTTVMIVLYSVAVILFLFGVNSSYLVRKLMVLNVTDDKLSILRPSPLSKLSKPIVIDIASIKSLDFILFSPTREQVKTLITKNGMKFELTNEYSSRSYFENLIVRQFEDELDNTQRNTSVSVDVNYFDKKQFRDFIVTLNQEYPHIKISSSLQNFLSYCRNI